MSIHATAWVRRNEVSPPSDKFILFVLADYCNSWGLAYPSVTRLTLDTGYDRKTVLAALQRLKDKKLIIDTGKRTGITKRVVVYRLAWARDEPAELDEPEIVPKAEPFQKRNSSVMIPNSPAGVPKQSQSTLENHQERKERTPLPPKGGVGKSGAAEADRIAAIFNRRKTTPWSEKEVKAFKKLLPFDDDELTMVERYYKAMRGKDGNICRRDIFTFLNNYRGEVDRAYAYCQRHPIKSKPVRFQQPAAPEPTDEELAARKERVHGMVEELRAKFRMPNGQTG